MAFSANLRFLEAGDEWTTAERPNGTLHKARYRVILLKGKCLETIFPWPLQTGIGHSCH